MALTGPGIEASSASLPCHKGEKGWVGEDHEWGLLTEASRDEARNECIIEENLSPSTQNVAVWENENLLK